MTVGRLNIQKPCPSRMGIFVERMATEMFAIMGIAANRLSGLRISSAPQTILHTPTTGARTSGWQCRS